MILILCTRKMKSSTGISLLRPAVPPFSSGTPGTTVHPREIWDTHTILRITPEPPYLEGPHVAWTESFAEAAPLLSRYCIQRLAISSVNWILQRLRLLIIMELDWSDAPTFNKYAAANYQLKTAWSSSLSPVTSDTLVAILLDLTVGVDSPLSKFHDIQSTLPHHAASRFC